MKLFDLHCDTITACYDNGKSLVSNDLHIDLSRANFNRWIQLFAVWIDDTTRGEQAFEYFLNVRKYFVNQVEKYSQYITIGILDDNYTKCQAVLAVENGAVLGGKLDRITLIKNLGVRVMTLVWNGENELGGGVKTKIGLTDFGKKCVAEMERVGITVDCSHLNERGFNELCEINKQPIIATHSNTYSICNHNRNLKDYQITEIIKQNGLCGINLYPTFVNGNTNCTMDDIIRHIEHILSLGGENILSIGTDFDGAAMPYEINSIEKLALLYQSMLKYYSEEIVDKIMFYNAMNFFRN